MPSAKRNSSSNTPKKSAETPTKNTPKKSTTTPNKVVSMYFMRMWQKIVNNMHDFLDLSIHFRVRSV